MELEGHQQIEAAAERAGVGPDVNARADTADGTTAVSAQTWANVCAPASRHEDVGGSSHRGAPDMPSSVADGLSVKRARRAGPLRRLSRRVSVVLAALAGALTLMFAANELEYSRLSTERQSVEASFFNLLEGLGSENPAVRASAIGQIPSLIRRPVPVEGRPKLWEGLGYVLGLHRHEYDKPYHEDLQRLAWGLARQPKPSDVAFPMEADAFLNMLCELGAEGWYNAAARRPVLNEACLAWIWENAPAERKLDRPVFALLERSELAGVSLAGQRLERAQFSRSALTSVLFTDADLRKSKFCGAVLLKVSFENADLTDSDFSGAHVKSVSFRGADLRGVDFTGAILDAADFSGARRINLARGLR